jgi:hypothetical protein
MIYDYPRTEVTSARGLVWQHLFILDKLLRSLLKDKVVRGSKRKAANYIEYIKTLSPSCPSAGIFKWFTGRSLFRLFVITLMPKGRTFYTKTSSLKSGRK